MIEREPVDLTELTCGPADLATSPHWNRDSPRYRCDRRPCRGRDRRVVGWQTRCGAGFVKGSSPLAI